MDTEVHGRQVQTDEAPVSPHRSFKAGVWSEPKKPHVYENPQGILLRSTR